MKKVVLAEVTLEASGSDSNGVGGAGSYNSGSEQSENIAGYNFGNGSVKIASGKCSFIT